MIKGKIGGIFELHEFHRKRRNGCLIYGKMPKLSYNRKMQAKIILRYHFTHPSGKFQKFDNTLCWQGYRDSGTHTFGGCVN